MSGWEEAEGEGRGGGRENEMGGRGDEGVPRWEGDATAPVFRTAAGQRVSHDRPPSSDDNSTEKMLGYGSPGMTKSWAKRTM